MSSHTQVLSNSSNARYSSHRTLEKAVDLVCRVSHIHDLMKQRLDMQLSIYRALSRGNLEGLDLTINTPSASTTASTFNTKSPNQQVRELVLRKQELIQAGKEFMVFMEWMKEVLESIEPIMRNAREKVAGVNKTLLAKEETMRVWREVREETGWRH